MVIAEGVDVRFGEVTPADPPSLDASGALAAFLTKVTRAEMEAEEERKKVVAIVGKTDTRREYFELPQVWKENAKQRIVEGFARLSPSMSDVQMYRNADCAVSSFENSWHSYSVGATACLFDIQRFLRTFGLPLLADASEAEAAMAIAVASSNEQAASDYRQALRRHHSSLVKRLRYEHVSAVLDAERQQRQGASDPDPATQELAAEFAFAFRDGGLPKLCRWAQLVTAEVNVSEYRPTMRQTLSAFVANWPPNKFERVTQARAVQIARNTMPPVANATMITDEMILRDYRGCVAAANAEKKRMSEGNRKLGAWPGQYALPSRATCHALGWHELYDGFRELAVRADDAYAALPTSLQETCN